MPLLLAILVSLALAFFLSEILRKYGIPRVIGQIGAGLLLGIPILRSYFFNSTDIITFQELANVAVTLMFFFVGLEMNLRLFAKNIRSEVMISLFNTVLPFILAIILAYVLGLDILIGLIIGIAFAVSSQTITFDLLEEHKLHKTKLGNLIVATGAIDDIIEFFFISIILTFVQSQHTAIETILINLLAFVGILTIFKSLIIPKLIEFLEKQHSDRVLFMGALIIALMMGFLATVLGLSSLIGAFVAGAIMREVLHSGQHPRYFQDQNISKSLDTVAFGFFVPLFFVFVGMNIDVYDIQNMLLGLFLTVIAIVATVASSSIGALVAGRSPKEGLLMGLAMTPKGDVDIIVTSIAFGSTLITREIFSALLLMALGTTIIGTLLFSYFAKRWQTIL